MSKTYERIKSVAAHCGSRPHLIGAIVSDGTLHTPDSD